MTDASPRVRPHPHVRRWLRALTGIVLLTVVLGACGGVIGSFVSTTEALRNAGYGQVSVGLSGQDDVKVSASIDQAASPAELDEMAAIVWRDFHQRFDFLHLTLHASDRTVTADPSFGLLQSRLGARNPAYNRTSVHSGILRIGIAVLVAVIVVIILVVGLVVLLVRRRRRRRGPPAGPWGGPGAPPGGPWRPGDQWGTGQQAGPAQQWGQGGRWGQAGPGGPGAPAGPTPWGAPAPGGDDPHRPPPAW